MSEKTPNLQEQLDQTFENAKTAAQESNGAYRFSEQHGIQAVGGVLEPSIQRSEMGTIASTSKHAEVNNKHTLSMYESRVDSPIFSDSSETGKVKIYRTDSKGESYSHTFNDPNSARKFAKLIGDQATKRAISAGNNEQKAA